MVTRHKTVPTHVLLAEAINMAEFASSDFDEETEVETAAQDTSDESCLSPNVPLLFLIDQKHSSILESRRRRGNQSSVLDNESRHLK